MKTKKINKYIYGWKFYVDYGCSHGYEYEGFETTREDMLANKKAYETDCKYPFKITKGREINPDYKGFEHEKI